MLLDQQEALEDTISFYLYCVTFFHSKQLVIPSMYETQATGGRVTQPPCNLLFIVVVGFVTGPEDVFGGGHLAGSGSPNRVA